MVLTSRRTLALVLSLFLVALWLPSAIMPKAFAATQAGFEIDGDVTPAAALDWASPAVTSSPDFVVHDNAGGDTTGFGASSKESNAPSTWGNTASPPGKADIADVFTYAHNDGGNAYLDFAWTRLSSTGTDGYYLELNKKPNATHKVNGVDTSYPDRSSGDARFLINELGSGALTLGGAWTWSAATSSWTSVTPAAGSFDSAFNAAPVTPPQSATWGTDQFLEVSLDLSAILNIAPSCPSRFGYVNFRSYTGNSDNNLEDYVQGYRAPSGSTCSTLEIVKQDSAAGHADLAGATFKIEPDPRTGTPGTHADVTDNVTTAGADQVADANAADGRITVADAQPGSYTITEVAAPTGYKIDSTSGHLVTAPSAGVVTETFRDTLIQKSLKLVKASTSTGFDRPNQKIDYTYTLTNTGNVDLTAPYAVSDVVETSTNLAVACPSTPDPLPNDGGKTTVVCTATYTTTQADVNRGSVTNDAVGTATYGGGSVTSNHDSVQVKASRSPSLHLVKSATETTYDHAGQVLHYSYVLTNDGNVTLAAPYNVDDNKIAGADLSCPSAPATLRPNTPDSVTCTGTYTVSQAELDAGTTISNDAHGHAFDGATKIQSNLDSASVSPTRVVSLHLDKAVKEAHYADAGDLLHYTYTLTNTGKVTLDAPYGVSDDKIASVSCPSSPATLAPAAAVDCTATYAVTQSDVDGGSVLNHATATAKDGRSTVTSNQAQADVTALQRPMIGLKKSATTTSYAKVGDVLHYTYALTNNGNVTVSAPYSVDDDVINAAGGTVTCPLAPSSLAPGDSLACSGDYTVTQADLDAGSVHNTAVAHAFVGATKVDSAPSDATVTAVQAPSLSLVKKAAESSYAAAGDVIHYTYTVGNSGNVTLAPPYAIADDKLASADCSAGPATLAPGGSFTCTGTYPVTQTDVDAGDVVNIATAAATFGSKPVASPQATATVPADQKPALLLVKNAAEPSLAAAGDAVHYTYTLTNVGNVTLSAPYAVTDDKIASVDCPSLPATIAPAESVLCSATYTVTQDDVDTGGVTNHATATAAAPAGGVTSDPAQVTVPADQSPALRLVKTADKTSAGYGDTLTYSLSVTNVGNRTLTGVVVSDAAPEHTTYVDGSAAPSTASPTYRTGDGTVTWQVGELTPGATVSNLTFQVTIDEPDFDPTVGLAPEVIENVAAVEAAQVPTTPSNDVKTPVTAVLGVKVVRKPPTKTPELPFTGLPAVQALGLAAALVAVGLWIVSAGRRRRA